MKLKQKVLLQKTVSLVTGFLLVFQSLTPSLFISSKVFAQSETPTETVTPPTTAPTIEPTQEPTQTPSTEPTVAPTETVTPTPTVEITPTIVPTVTETPIPEETVTPTVEPTVTETPTTAPEQTNNNGPPAESTTNNTSSTAAASPTTTITPEPTITVEQPETGEIQATVIKNVAAPTLNLDGVNPDGSASLSTDKADYAPTDSAIISGKDFSANKTYQLIISSTDDPATSTTVNVTSDENGTFIYAYQLDGNYRPNYKAEVKDGDRTVATTTFLDHQPTVTICHASSSSSNPYEQQSPNIANDGSLTGGHLNHLGGVYPTPGWGDIIPSYNYGSFHYAGLNWTTAGQAIYNNDCHKTGSIKIIKSTNTGNGTFNFTSTGGNGLPTSFSITTTGNTGSVTYANLYTGSDDYTITESSPTGYSLTGLTCTSSDHDTSLGTSVSNRKATINNLQDGDNVTCTFTNSQLTGSISGYKYNDHNGNHNWEYWDWDEYGMSGWTIFLDTNNSQTKDTGESSDTTDSWGYYSFSNLAVGTYHVCEVQQSGWTNTDPGTVCQTVTIPDTYNDYTVEYVDFGNHQSPTGTVIVHKDVQGPTGQNITDTSTNFTVQLDGTNSQTITDNGTVTYSNVTSGNHTITELAAPSGYSIYGISTTQGTSGNTNGLSVAVGSGTTHVYVTNRQQQGTITVYKDVRISSGVDASDNHTFTTQLDGANNSSFSENSPKSFTVPSGTHSINELTETGYTNMGCKLATGAAATNFTVPNGGTISVTCTNYQIKPALTLVKTVVKNNGGSAAATAWTLQAVGPVTISGVTGNSAVTNVAVTAGTYTLSENNGPAGYTASLYSCVKNGGSAVLSNSITLALGDTAICTITNDDQAAILHVVKNLLGSTDPKSDFSFSVNGKPMQAFETDGQNDLTVDAGTYSVVESTATGYATTYDHCTNVVIGNGGEATCTITNTKYGSISGYKYEDQNGTIETENTDTNPVSGWSISLWKLVGDTWTYQSDTTTDELGYYTFTNLVPADYQIREEAQTNWTNLLPTTINVALSAGANSEDKNFLNTYVDETDKRVTLCHATASETNPFNQITVSTSGAYHGHIAHEDVKDIIPPFVYNDTTYQQNWDTIGQAIWNNNCDPNIYGTIQVTKYNDTNNNGYRDEGERTLSDWQIHLDETTERTSETGVAEFTNLIYGTYTLSETVGDGWAQTNIRCDGEEGIDKENSHTVTVHAGQTTTCEIGNYYAPPKLQLSKINNASGNLTTGSTITYTMTLKAQDNKSYNVKVTDLVPQGFAFTGAWTAMKNGSPMSISAPTYHSPGTWSLGDLAKDDEVVLTMTVQVADSQKPGIYKDLALAYGCETDNTCSDVVATAETGKVTDTFVGTNVAIVKEQQDSKTLTVAHTETTEGSVLGATTDLPSTGANGNWIIVAITLVITGLGSVIVANRMRRYHA